MKTSAIGSWRIHARRSGFAACHNGVPNANPVTAITAGFLEESKLSKDELQGLEGTMFNWARRDYAPEIFALALTIGVLVALADLIPA